MATLSDTEMENEWIEKQESVEEPLPFEPERNYLPIENFCFDWNMMLYGDHEEGFQIDWNKLIYNDEQLLEFKLKKDEKLLRPEHYEYLFKRNSERSEIEKYFLRQSGFCAYDNDSDEEMDVVRERRLVIDNTLRSA